MIDHKKNRGICWLFTLLICALVLTAGIRTTAFAETTAGSEAGNAYVASTVSYDEHTGMFSYTIRVTADAELVNVNVTGDFSGEALIFNNDLVVSGGSSGYVGNSSLHGFDYTFASMQPEDEIRITLSAGVNFSKDQDNDGIITDDQTKCVITAQPEGGAIKRAVYSREIAYKTTSVSTAQDEGGMADGNNILEWTVTYNSPAVVSAAGESITAELPSNDECGLRFYGDGIFVRVTDQSGVAVEERGISYGDMKSFSDTSFEYIIPKTDTGLFSYEIILQTVSEKSAIDENTEPCTLSLKVNGASGNIVVYPSTGVFLEAASESFGTSEITWISKIHVPSEGLDEAVFTDTFPSINEGELGISGSEYLRDSYKEGSLSVSGLYGDESYDLDTSDPSQLKITFYKDTEKTQGGLQENFDGSRIITVRLTTEVNQTWLEAGYQYPCEFQACHKNIVSINNDGEEATASVRFDGQSVKNEVSDQGSGRFKYTMMVSGVQNGLLVINDYFDREIMEIDLSTESSDWNKEVFYISGMSDFNGYDIETRKVNYSETETGIQIYSDNLPRQDSGEYYPVYRITFFLKLKDGLSLEALADLNGGMYELLNNAEWGEMDASAVHTTCIRPVFTGYQMVLSSEIGVQFRVTVPEDFDTSGSYMSFSVSDGRRSTMEISEALNDGAGVWRFTCYVNALELADTITATYHYGEDGELTGTYSVISYIDAAKNLYAGNTELLALVDALQNYGHYMQSSGWTDGKDHAAIACVTELDNDSISSARTGVSGMAMVKTADGSGILADNIRFALTLNAQTVINVFVKAEDGVTVTSVAGASERGTKTIGGETFMQYDTAQIGAGSLGKTYTVTITTDQGEASLSASAMSYVNAVLSSSSFTKEKQLAMTAYYNYYAAANAYQS